MSVDVYDVINYHITNACNYRCKYCFGKFTTEESLTIDQAYKVVDNISKYFTEIGKKGRISLAGGEPLLYKDIELLIDYIHDKDIEVSIITNGSLLTKERIEGWKGKVCSVGLSVDSLQEHTNLEIGRCLNNNTLSLNKLYTLCNAIHSCGIKLKINTVVSKLNCTEDFTDFYKTVKPERLKLFQMQVVDCVNNECAKYRISKEEFIEFSAKYNSLGLNVIAEAGDMMQNSYIMIDPVGNILLNDCGKYKTYGSCITNDLSEVVKLMPLDEKRYGFRY